MVGTRSLSSGAHYARPVGSANLRIRIDQRALGDQPIDFSIGKAGLAQNFPAVLAKAQPRIMVA